MSAYVHPHEWSRRPAFVTEKKVEENWLAGLGERKPLICKACNKRAGRLINGECDDCRRERKRREIISAFCTREAE